MRANVAKMEVAELRGRQGLWQLEAWCGQCGSGHHCGSPVAVRTEALAVTAMRRRPLCNAVYVGQPGNRCRWPFSFGWVFVPLRNPQ